MRATNSGNANLKQNSKQIFVEKQMMCIICLYSSSLLHTSHSIFQLTLNLFCVCVYGVIPYRLCIKCHKFNVYNEKVFKAHVFYFLLFSFIMFYMWTLYIALVHSFNLLFCRSVFKSVVFYLHHFSCWCHSLLLEQIKKKLFFFCWNKWSQKMKLFP